MKSDLIEELEPVVAENLNRHLATAKEWMPHRYVPWGEGRDFEEFPWEPEQSTFTPAIQAALEVNLLTEDNLPSYHHEIAVRFGRDGAWGTWVHQWTAEESRHATAIRDYLLTTRAVDPDELERNRMLTMRQGYDAQDRTVADACAYVSFQELATRIAHRNTGRLSGDPRAERLLARVAADENLHMVFYRNLVTEALAVDPSAMTEAICREAMAFKMPGDGLPGFRRKAAAISRADIYNLRIHHDDVLQPLLRHWKIFDVPRLNPTADQARDDLAAFLTRLSRAAGRQTERHIERHLEPTDPSR